MIEEKELENIFFPKKIRYMELFEEKKYDEAWEVNILVRQSRPSGVA